MSLHVKRVAIQYFAIMLYVIQLIMREAGCVDEPGLQDRSKDTSLCNRTNTQAGARLDVSARGIFGTFERTFCDVRVSHPNCPSSVYKPIADIYKEHEAAKRSGYEVKQELVKQVLH
jgi:hypothetical protein